MDTYTAQATVGDVNKGLNNHKVNSYLTTHDAYSDVAPQNLESSDTALLVFGNGDGGGGPLAKMLENVSLPRQSDRNHTSKTEEQLRRIRAVTNTHRELPPVNMGHSVEEFFEDIQESTKDGKTLPNW